MQKTLADYEKQVYELFDSLNTTNSLFKIAEQWYEESNRLEKLVMPKNYGQILSGVDEEIRGLVDILNRNGYETVASCSGHGKLPGNIALKDGRELFIIENYDKARLATKLLIEAGLYSPLNE